MLTRRQANRRCKGCEHNKPGCGIGIPSLKTRACMYEKRTDTKWCAPKGKGRLAASRGAGWYWERYPHSTGYHSIYMLDTCPMDA